MKSYKFETTNEYFDYLDFHDCFVEKIQVGIDVIIIDFEYVNISEQHPLNPYKVAKSTGQCRLTFNEVAFSKAFLYIDLNPVLISDWEEEEEDEEESEFEEKQVLITDLVEMEFLKFEEKRVENDCFIFEIFGLDWRTHGGFCGLRIHAKNFTLQWNELTDDAWYVGWDNQE